MFLKRFELRFELQKMFLVAQKLDHVNAQIVGHNIRLPDVFSRQDHRINAGEIGWVPAEREIDPYL